MVTEQLGSWAFILGVLIAVITGLVMTFVALGTAAQWITLVLVILGFIVGFTNISGKELNDFLTAGIALVLVSGFAMAPLLALDTLIPTRFSSGADSVIEGSAQHRKECINPRMCMVHA